MAHSHEQSLLARLGFADPDRKDKRHTLACQYLCEPEVARKVLQVAGGDVEPKDAPPIIRVDYERVEAPDPPVLSEGEIRVDKGTDDDIIFARNQEDAAKEHPLSGVLTERLIVREYRGGSWYKETSGDKIPARTAIWVAVTGTSMEVTLNKRGGFLVGFADLIIRYGAHWWQDVHKEFTVTERAYELEGGYFGDPGRARIVEFQDCAGVDCIPVKHEDVNRGTILVEVKSQPIDVADILKQIAVYRDCQTFNACVVATCYQMSATDKATLKAAGIRHIYLGDGFKAYCAKRADEKPVEETGI